MNKAFVNWIVEEEKMPCIYHSFMSPKGILKKPLLRQINLPLAKALFYKVSRGLKSIGSVQRQQGKYMRCLYYLPVEFGKQL